MDYSVNGVYISIIHQAGINLFSVVVLVEI